MYLMPVPVAARSKAKVCGRSPAEIVGSNPTGACMFVFCKCCVLSGRGLCNELITRPEESYWLWCVVVCDLENLKDEEAMTRVGSQRHKNNNKCGVDNSIYTLFNFSSSYSHSSPLNYARIMTSVQFSKYYNFHNSLDLHLCTTCGWTEKIKESSG